MSEWTDESAMNGYDLLRPKVRLLQSGHPKFKKENEQNDIS